MCHKGAPVVLQWCDSRAAVVSCVTEVLQWCYSAFDGRVERVLAEDIGGVRLENGPDFVRGRAQDLVDLLNLG